ncbi:MAG: phosphoribosylglycinamide formyltransferase [Fibrobacteria bacterium]|nr:phosphoribosylglycinamide formyltransferase [Fibrobacteria bacterium]
MTAPFKYAVLASGGGSNFQALLDHLDPGIFSENPTEAAFVASNNSKAFVLERARKRGIPAYHISSVSSVAIRLLEDHGVHAEDPEERVSEALLLLLKTHPVHLLVLAGYMKKVPDAVLKHMKNRVINIHPALLPEFGGAGMYGHHVHEAVARAGKNFSGMTIHMVNEQYDEGQIILQRRTDDINTSDPAFFARFVLQREHDSYWRVLRGFATGDIVPTDSDDPSQAVRISDAWKREMRNLSGTVFP